MVNRYEVTEPLTILLRMKNADFNPRDVVFLKDSLDVKVDPPGESASAEIMEYQIQKIKLKVKATGNNLLFLSEVWYPRWKCFIDGKEAPIYRANYVFRAVVVPPGEHEVLFIYKDEKFELGGKISLALNLFIIALFFVSLAPNVIGMLKKKFQK